MNDAVTMHYKSHSHFSVVHKASTSEEDRKRLPSLLMSGKMWADLRGRLR